MTTDRPLHLGLVVHRTRPEAQDIAGLLAKLAERRGLRIDRVMTDDDGRWETPRDEGLDFVVGIGGDGTLLEAALVAHGVGVPVVGVNLGTVGYLTDFEPDALDSLLDVLASAHPPLTPRMTLVAEAEDGRRWHGINDVVVEKLIGRRIVALGVEIDDHYFTTYRSDGIIVATPLGSTAYSLSAGGPVLDPELEALVLTPVAPHSLLSRSLVLAPDTTITITVAGDRGVLVNLDGREASALEGGESMTVRRGDRPVQFVSPGAHPFPQGVRKQFGIDHA